jgi:hypothetical protein
VAADQLVLDDPVAICEETRVASFVRFRSAADSERATEENEFLEQMRTLEALGTSDGDAYERTAVIAPPRDHGPIRISFGAF